MYITKKEHQTSWEKGASNKKADIKIIPDFSTETKDRRAQTDVLKTLRNHRCHPKILYPAKVSISIDGKNKTSMTKLNFNNIDPQIQPSEDTTQKTPSCGG